jgi:hypothetical protein
LCIQEAVGAVLRYKSELGVYSIVVEFLVILYMQYGIFGLDVRKPVVNGDGAGVDRSDI